jgi:hypothetical protein
LADDEFAAQLAMTLPECRLCLQLVAMRDHLMDDDWVAQPMALSECVHPLEYAVIRDHLADNERAAQPMML